MTDSREIDREIENILDNLFDSALWSFENHWTEFMEGEEDEDHARLFLKDYVYEYITKTVEGLWENNIDQWLESKWKKLNH